MVRVVFVSSYPPVHGRLSEYAYNLIDELRKNPDVSHIDVITEVAGPAARENVGDKVTVHRLYRPDDPLSILAVPLKIIALKPDIVHFNVHMAVVGRSRVANFFGLSLPAICRAMGISRASAPTSHSRDRWAARGSRSTSRATRSA